MASNALPTNINQFTQLGYNMSSGLVSLGTTLKITQITPAQFQTDLTAFVDADNAFNAARSARKAASEELQTAVTEISDWLSVVRGVLTGVFGPRWNTMWAQAGFTNNSTAVPAKTDARVGLTARLAAFFTANANYEVASMEVTAAKAKALGSAAQSATRLLAAAVVAITTQGQNWDDAYATLVKEMRDLIKILEVSLSDTDPRWKAFGLNIPSAETTPGQPQNLTAHLDESGAIVVQCDALAMAARYRWRMLIVGVQTAYKLAASTTDPMAGISGVEPGQTVQLLVQGVNGSLQGVPSEVVLFTLPAAKTVAAVKREPVAEAPAGGYSHGNGNGSRNGREAQTV